MSTRSGKVAGTGPKAKKDREAAYLGRLCLRDSGGTPGPPRAAGEAARLQTTGTLIGLVLLVIGSYQVRG
jgi:hypothetical protein